MVSKKFAEDVLAGVAERLGEEATAELDTVEKNNGLKLTAVKITGKGSRVSIMVYLDYVQDMGKERAADWVVGRFEKNADNAGRFEDVTWVFDWEKAKDKVVLCVVGKKGNEGRLENMAHKDFLDLAVVYKILLEEGEELVTMTISSRLSRLWGISEQELYETAKTNSQRLMPQRITSIGEIMAETTGQDSFREEDGWMWILTNDKRRYGAGAILYDGALEQLSDKIGGDLLIIPSSVHEVIAVKADGISGHEVASMIASVNQTQLQEDEVLGWHPYIYRKDSGELKVA